MPPTAAHLSGVSASAGPTGPLRTAGAAVTQHNNHRWADQLMGQGVAPMGVSLQAGQAGQLQPKPDIITIYRAAAAADRMAGSHDETDSEEDDMEDEEAMSLNGDDSSSGSGTGGLLAPPPPVVVTAAATVSHYSNPAASLVPSCPCGCKEEDDKPKLPGQNGPLHVYPESPASSPIKSRYPSTNSSGSSAADGPLDMSKTSPVYGSSNKLTPPPTPPESDRETFRSLYMLVDAAVGQLEKEQSRRAAEEAQEALRAVKPDPEMQLRYLARAAAAATPVSA